MLNLKSCLPWLRWLTQALRFAANRILGWGVAFILALMLANSVVNAQDLVWAKRAGGSGEDFGHGIAVDEAGNSYVTGVFGVSATFGPGEANETTLTGTGFEIFVAKYNASGALVWVKRAGGSGSDHGLGIAVDGSGNSYVTGGFTTSAIFGPGEANEITLSGTNREIFVAKYDANGALVWAKRAGGSGFDSGWVIAVDGSGNSYVTSFFENSATFGPGEANETTVSGTGYEIYVAKYDANGALVWAKRAGGSGSGEDFGISIAVDGSGNSYATGFFVGSATFGPGETNETILSGVNYEAFVAKFQGATAVAVKPFVFLAEERIVIQGQASSAGDIHSNDYIHFDKGLFSTHDGNITAVGNIKISQKNIITGDVKAGGDIDNFGTINGVVMENDPSVVAIPITSLPTFSAGTDNVTVAKGTTMSLAPGTYGVVTVQKNGKLELAHDGSSGDYFFKSLEVNENAVLDIDVSSGAVNINVTSRIKFIKNVEVEITPAEDTEKVFFNNTNTATIKIGSGSKVFGNIVAPDALVELKKNSGFKGAICANVIKVNVGATFLHHNSSMSLPKASAVSEEDNDESSVETTSIPKEFELVQNYPNPFNPSTTITFAVPKAGEVKLSVYNLKGQLVRTLVSGPAAAGWHKVVWDGTNQQENQVASGIYVYSLESKDFRAHRKLVLAR